MQNEPKVLAGTYIILEEIGSGGGGIVYKAWHKRLEKEVVLKSIKRKEAIRSSLHRVEVDILKSLKHNYLPQVYDFIDENNEIYTVMEYIKGESLDKRLSANERFSQATVIQWARQISEALVYLHSQNPPILHSDIKPANIMLTSSGDICLIDFNIALVLGDDGAVVVGRSHGYASPEQYGAVDLLLANSSSKRVEEINDTLPMTDPLEGSPGSTIPMYRTIGEPSTEPVKATLDIRSDIYSLGATIYHLLTGIRPPAMGRDVIPLSEIGAFSQGLIDIVEKAMKINPNERYQTAAEFLEDLNNLPKKDKRYKRFIRQRYVSIICMGLLFLCSGFLSLLGLKQMELKKDALVNVEYSHNALLNGDTSNAVEYAMKALPEIGILTPSYIPEAQNAIANALGVYEVNDGYSLDYSLELPSPPIKSAISPSGKYAVFLCGERGILLDMYSGKTIADLSMEASALADFKFIDNNTLIYAAEKGISAYNIQSQTILWEGEPTTGISISGDGKVIAGVYKDEGQAYIYDIEGNTKGVVSFGDKIQRVLPNDGFADPNNSLFALNQDGSQLAVSFSDGSLIIFDTQNPVNSAALMEDSEAVRFEGGYHGKYLAFSATEDSNKNSVFAIVNTEEMSQTGGFQQEGHFSVKVDDGGIYISKDNIIVQIDPETGKQQEIAYTNADVVSFAGDDAAFLVSTDDYGYSFYDRNANLLNHYDSSFLCNIVNIQNGYALVGGLDSPMLRILKLENYSENDLFSYDPSYWHDEARINKDQTRVILFSYKDFQLYEMDGALIKKVDIPDSEHVFDQQYDTSTGNLMVMYPTALRIYSGTDGSLIFEKEGLRSVFYAPYGVSILDENRILHLINPDGTAEEIESISGEFAAYCGMVVDDAFLRNSKLIGAGKIDGKFVFATSDGDEGTVYDQNGRAQFEFEVKGQAEAFFVNNYVIVSPLHGTPSVYDVGRGDKVMQLEKEAYLTYATPIGDYIVSEYVSGDGNRFGYLMDQNCQIIAYLPDLSDIGNNQLIFDYQTGVLRGVEIYSISELIEMGRERSF